MCMYEKLEEEEKLPLVSSDVPAQSSMKAELDQGQMPDQTAIQGGQVPVQGMLQQAGQQPGQVMQQQQAGQQPGQVTQQQQAGQQPGQVMQQQQAGQQPGQVMQQQEQIPQQQQTQPQQQPQFSEVEPQSQQQLHQQYFKISIPLHKWILRYFKISIPLHKLPEA